MSPPEGPARPSRYKRHSVAFVPHLAEAIPIAVRGAFALFLVLVIASARVEASVPADASRADIVVGALLHDRGFFSDRHEDGFDLTAEIVGPVPDVAVWRDLSWLRPHAGLTISTQGETSFAYAGLTATAGAATAAFVSLGGGLAVHDGPLSKPALQCSRDSDCGFGSRVLLRGALELGWRFDDGRAVSVLYDHASHGGLLGDQNEGVDHIGLRYRFQF